MNRIIVIGDVHGCYEELKELVQLLNIHISDRLICVGDLLDKGPKSLEVVELPH